MLLTGLLSADITAYESPSIRTGNKMVHDALKPGSTPLPDYENEAGGIRWVSEVLPLAATDASVESEFAEARHPVPDWLFEQAPKELELPWPLTPSGAHALIDENMKVNRRPPFEFLDPANPHALKAGKIMHHLLEVLPGLASQDQQGYARRYVDHHCPNWPKADKKQDTCFCAGYYHQSRLSANFHR